MDENRPEARTAVEKQPATALQPSFLSFPLLFPPSFLIVVSVFSFVCFLLFFTPLPPSVRNQNQGLVLTSTLPLKCISSLRGRVSNNLRNSSDWVFW